MTVQKIVHLFGQSEWIDAQHPVYLVVKFRNTYTSLCYPFGDSVLKQVVHDTVKAIALKELSSVTPCFTYKQDILKLFFQFIAESFQEPVSISSATSRRQPSIFASFIQYFPTEIK